MLRIGRWKQHAAQSMLREQSSCCTLRVTAQLSSRHYSFLSVGAHSCEAVELHASFWLCLALTMHAMKRQCGRAAAERNSEAELPHMQYRHACAHMLRKAFQASISSAGMQSSSLRSLSVFVICVHGTRGSMAPLQL